jgi:hypothetical protein
MPEGLDSYETTKVTKNTKQLRRRLVGYTSMIPFVPFVIFVVKDSANGNGVLRETKTAFPTLMRAGRRRSNRDCQIFRFRGPFHEPTRATGGYAARL